MNVVIAIIVIGLAAAFAWYISGHVVKPSRQRRQAQESSERLVVVQRRGWDSWEGFAIAHREHPAAYPENDSWIKDV